MKTSLSITLFLFFCFGFAQPKVTNFKDKYDEFDYYAEPSPNSDLTTFFKKHIDLSLLEKVKINYKEDYRKRLFLTFRIEDGKVKYIRTTAIYSELSQQFVEAFKKYDINKLNIEDLNALNMYSLQLTSWQDGKAILNCSQNAVVDRFPVFEGCESVPSYFKMAACIGKKVEDHVVKHITAKDIKNAKLIGVINLKPNIVFDEKGQVRYSTFKTASDTLNLTLRNMMRSFPQAIHPPTRNGNPTVLFHNYRAVLEVDDIGGSYTDDVIEDNQSEFGLSSTNKFAMHFKKYLGKEELDYILKHVHQKAVFLTFNLDKKNRPINISTTVFRNEDINDKLVRAFKKFPEEALNIESPDVLNRYSIHLISNINGIKTFECSNKPSVGRPPVFAGCQKSKKYTDLTECLYAQVAGEIQRKFDVDLGKKTKLTGTIRILSRFKVNAKGDIVGVKIQSPNPFLSSEVETILKEMPKAISPGLLDGKPVSVPFSLPVVLEIEPNKPEEDPFKGLRKGM
ncbi:hypothetical protein Q4566_13480 [Tamlana sp. 2_MG-2023]|uniref:energy transducer TonB n=1 Tax=unclassified Tamlana TaxID=2614803 RepID=UPI0026E20E1D|nr:MULTISPECIES: hypothetical protein [unclassified Tamlana]MDO6761217.1 hypothetical protein [Tamlana sp. 2_MG-2023]MDO6791700.1 hypothetical protein [Tamlana sp. 1_MG-2023]